MNCPAAKINAWPLRAMISNPKVILEMCDVVDKLYKPMLQLVKIGVDTRNVYLKK